MKIQANIPQTVIKLAGGAAIVAGPVPTTVHPDFEREVRQALRYSTGWRIVEDPTAPKKAEPLTAPAPAPPVKAKAEPDKNAPPAEPAKK